MSPSPIADKADLFIDHVRELYAANGGEAPADTAEALKRIRDESDALLTALKEAYGEDIVPA